MNIEFYRNYIAIVESGTLSAASRRLHVAQSALSMQVKQFEEEYHAQLFVRNARVTGNCPHRNDAGLPGCGYDPPAAPLSTGKSWPPL